MQEPLDGLSFGVFSYLKKHPRVSHLESKSCTGASSVQLALWEQKHYPCLLPDDLKRFYTVSNGLSIKWFVHFRGESNLVGHFTINSIQDLQKIHIKRFVHQCRPSDQHRLSNFSNLDTQELVAFPLESSTNFGDVTVVYFADGPQIWFRDLTGKWSFLADSFANYYRMMIAHLGIIGWQAIFSDSGVDPIRKPWFYMFIPTRIVVDEQDTKEIQLSKSAPVERSW